MIRPFASSRLTALAFAVSATCSSLLPSFSFASDLDAAKEFDQLFGEAVKAAIATPDAADDVSLANKLVDAAKNASDKLPLMTVMLEKAYDLSAKDPTGTATAINAMETLADRLPDRKVAATQKILLLLQRDYSRAKPADIPAAAGALISKFIELGDAHASAGDLPYAIADYSKALPVAVRSKSPQEPLIRTQIQSLTHRYRIESQVGILQERILKDRTDKASANDLVTLYVTELNRPSAAQQYLDIVTDEDTKKFVPLAAQDLGETETPQLLLLGTWYEGLSKKVASIPGKRTTLTRAESYLESYIEKQTEDELTKLQAQLALKRVQATLKELSPETASKEPAEKIFNFTGKPLAIEAEKAQVIEEPMKIEKTGSATGGAYIWRPGTIGQRVVDGPGHVVFHVKVAEATEVYLWGRVRSLGGEANSFYLAVEADKVTTGNRRDWNLPDDTRNWVWAPYAAEQRRRGGGGGGRFGQPPREPEPTVIRLEKGINSIIVLPREHGAQLDSIYLSKTNEKPR